MRYEESGEGKIFLSVLPLVLSKRLTKSLAKTNGKTTCAPTRPHCRNFFINHVFERHNSLVLILQHIKITSVVLLFTFELTKSMCSNHLHPHHRIVDDNSSTFCFAFCWSVKQIVHFWMAEACT